MKFKFYKLVLLFGVIVFVITIPITIFFKTAISEQIPLDDVKIFYIYRKQDLSTILNNLSKENIIRNPFLIKCYLKIFKRNITFQQGEYIVKPYETITDLIQKFSKGLILKRKLTVIEGITVKKVKQLLEREEVLTGEIIEEIEEGFLYPTTYYFNAGNNRNELLKKMYNDMNNAINTLCNTNPNKFKSVKELVILASIIEKETHFVEEKPRIAAVFINRLRKNMRLQADPTIIYDLSDKIGYIDRSLTYNDLKLDSPYNTYKVQGLPPTAISIPSITSIKAALNPTETDDLYFVVNKKGGHCFSNNLASHNINVMKYRANIQDECY